MILQREFLGTGLGFLEGKWFKGWPSIPLTCQGFKQKVLLGGDSRRGVWVPVGTGLSQEWEWESASLSQPSLPLPRSHLTFSLTPSAPGLEDWFQFSDHFSWWSEREKVQAVTDFIFLSSKITVDGDCSHEVKRCLLLGRNAITNVDSILKSRDVTLPTKVRAVKAMVAKIPWRSIWWPTPVLVPGEIHGQRSLMDYNPWGHKELGTTEWLTLSLMWSS